MSAVANENAIEVMRPTPLPTQRQGPRLDLPSKVELDALMAYGQVIVKSGLAPTHIKTPEAAIVMMRYGHQLGIDEFTALQHMYIQNGKPTALASLLHSLILRDHGGDAIQIVEASGETCRLACKRRDGAQRTEISYTIQEAERAGLLDKPGPWKQYPADMLFARCVSRAGRMLYRDSTLGLYTPEELGANYIEVQGEVIDAGAGEVPRDEQPASTNRLANLHRIGAERGLDHEALHRIAMLKRGHGFGGGFTDTMLRDFETMIEQAADEELRLWSTDWIDEIAGAVEYGKDAVIVVGEQIKAAGITQKSHPDIAQAFAAAIKRVKDEPVEVVDPELPGMPADADRHTA